MALITGSTTIDWSTVALQPIDVPQQIDEFTTRLNQAITEYNDQTVTVLSATSVLLSFRLSNGATVTVRGSGFLDSNDSVVRSFEYSNPATNEFLRFTGTIALHTQNDITTVTSMRVNGLTVDIPGFEGTIIGNIVVNPLSGDASGSITELQETIGSTHATLKGNLVLSGNTISGTVTQISVVSGANTILMSGLSLPYSVLDSVTTANDLFSVVGTQLPGNDTITYTNNSGVAMSFFGGAGNDTITISGLNGDTLDGGSGNDILNGGAGDDTLLGGDGNDVFVIGSAADHGVGEIITGGTGDDVIRFTSTMPGQTLVLAPGVTEVERVTIGTAAGVTTGTTALNVDASAVTTGLSITGNGGANELIGTDFNDVLVGNAGNDELEGEGGSDTLDGGLGNDTLVGGTGDDTYVIGQGIDVLTENLNEGTDTVQSLVTYTLGANFENLTLTGVGAINGTGNELANVLTGNSAANILLGADGNDTLTGNAGNDTLNGSTGDDAMDGGAGNDTYVVDSLSDTVTDTIPGAAGGVDLVQSAVDFTLDAGATNVEHLTLTGSALNGTGNALNNILTGNSGDNVLTGLAGNDRLIGNDGNDTLDGGAGVDSMIGGLGNDTYVRDAVTDVITEALNAGMDTVQSSLNYILGANLENLELTGAALTGTGNTLNNIITGTSGNNTLTGLAGNDSLNGSDGNDTLIGGLGADTMDGGLGDDQFVVDSAADTVTEAVGEGSDTVRIAYNVAAATLIDLNSAYGGTVEHVQVIGTGLFNLTGNTADNILTGNGSANTLIGGDGNDSLDGGVGADTLTGGLGDDTYTIDNLGDQLTELDNEGIDTVRINRTVNLELTFTEVENAVLTGATALNATGNGDDNHLTGNSAANILSGSDGVDTLVGLAGNDILNGGIGDDAMDGGAGNDTYVVDSQSDTVTESLAGAAGGVDLVQSAVDFTLDAGATNVEHLTLTGAALIGAGNALNNILTGNSGHNQLTGGAGNDRLIGNDGNDTLDGGAGVDTMVGGLGNDTYVRDAATDVITEALNAGTDTVQSSLNYTLGANLENLELTGAALTGTGNTLNNILTGTSGNNTLTGLAGNDSLVGGAGNDLLDGGLGQDTVNGEAGDDQITMLVTAGNVDTIDAGDGTDTLVLSGVVPGTHEVVVDLSQADQVMSIGGTPDALVQTNFENLTAAGIGSFVTATGSAGDNVIVGSNGNDTITGGAGNDTLIGGVGRDNLQGGIGNDVILLNSVAEFSPGETIDGGDGTDTLRYTGATAATLTLTNLVTNIEQVEIANVAGNTNGTAAINVNAAAITSNGMTLVGNNGANLFTGTGQADTLIGNAGNDQLNGGTGDDILIGGAGADRLTGGGGIDLYVYNAASDSTLSAMDVIVGFTQGEDQIDLRPLGVTDITFNDLTPTAHGVWYQQSGGNTFVLVDVNGNTSPDIKIQLNGLLTLTSADFLGVALPLFSQGADTVDFNAVMAGTYIAGTQYDALEGDDNVTLPNDGAAALAAGFDPTQTFHGGAGNDTITGGGLNDMIDGDAGSDTLTGGLGDDVFLVDNAGDSVFESANGGTDTVRSSWSFTLPDNIENLVLLAGNGQLHGTGNSLNNTITGNDISTILNGGAGNDLLLGGNGPDFFDFDSGTAQGADTMIGGAGDDSYFVDNAGDLVIESDGGGVMDVVFLLPAFSGIYMLPDNIENGSIMQASAGGIELIGNVLGNFLAGEGDGGYVLRGGAGNDRLATNGGANQLFGGEGDDTYQTWGHDLIVEAFGEGYDTVQVALSSSYTLPANIERLENAPEWAGGNPNATLTGNELDNFILGGRTIYGLAGNDTLIGTGMIGGLGDDTYIAGAGSTVLENAGEGKDTVEFQGSVFDASYFLSDNVENLTLRHGFGGEDGFGNDLDNVIIGNDSNNQLFGAGGNDLLSGGAGADFMDGGLGNDTFIVDNVADDVSDDPQPEAGIDTVEASVSYSLSAGINRYVENLTLTGDTAINGTGNGLDNTIIGNNASNTLTGGFGNDLLDGRGGADTMIGGSGDDTYVVDSFGDVVTEQSNDGTDTVNSYIDYSLTSRPNIEHLNLLGTAVSGTGNANDNRLIGNIIGNTLVGAGGNDTLIGGEGNDFLVGQLGSDTYQVNRGEGQDTILENASTPGDSDTLLYGATINPVDVVLSRQVNDLRLSIHGGADQVTIQSWYTNSNSQVETIQAGNGQILLSTQVDQLIQAMAQFTTDTGLSWDAAAGGAGTVQQQAQFQGILAANWQSVGS